MNCPHVSPSTDPISIPGRREVPETTAERTRDYQARRTAAAVVCGGSCPRCGGALDLADLGLGMVQCEDMRRCQWYTAIRVEGPEWVGDTLAGIVGSC